MAIQTDSWCEESVHAAMPCSMSDSGELAVLVVDGTNVVSEVRQKAIHCVAY